jgi:hypothetical protein
MCVARRTSTGAERPAQPPCSPSYCPGFDAHVEPVRGVPRAHGAPGDLYVYADGRLATLILLAPPHLVRSHHPLRTGPIAAARLPRVPQSRETHGTVVKPEPRSPKRTRTHTSAAPLEQRARTETGFRSVDGRSRRADMQAPPFRSRPPLWARSSAGSTRVTARGPPLTGSAWPFARVP